MREYEEYGELTEEEAWQETLCDVQVAPCYKCGGTKRHTEYNTHEGAYCTFDKICDECGYVILSLLD